MFRKIASYSASIYGVTMGASAISFLVTMIVARRIPREALGAYGFYVTIYALLGMLLASGFNQAVVKFLGDDPQNRRDVVRVVLAAFGALCLVFLPAAAIAWAAGGGVVWIFGLAAIPPSVLIILANSVFRAEFRRRNEIVTKMSVSLLNSCGTLSFAFLLGNPVRAPIWGDFLSLLIPSAVIVALFLREGRMADARGVIATLRSSWAFQLLTFSVPLLIAGVAFQVYANAASLLLRALAGLAALGEYYFALQLMNVLEKPMTILASVVLAGFATDPDIPVEEHRRLVGFNLLLFPLLAAAVAWGAPLLLAIADVALGHVKGEPLSTKYAMAPAYVALFALAVPARCVEFLISTLAIARGRPDVNRNTHVATAMTCLPLLALLVWRFGAWGAAAMPLGYQLVFQSIQAWQLRRVMPEILRHTLKSAVLATALLGALLAAARISPSPFLFPVGALLYVVLGHLTGAWDLRTLARPRPAAPARRSALARPSPGS